MIKPEKLEKDIAKLLNDRIVDEYNAFYLYRSASNWCKGVGFFKAADFFEGESKDELEHSKKLQDYLVDWNLTPQLPDINQPDLEFKSLVEVIERAYEIEYDLYEKYEKTTKQIFDKNDMCTFFFLQFFNDVQRKSVAEYSDKLNLLEGVGGTKFELLLLEEKLF